MEAFKFAFETIVIGLLALPWLAVMIDLAKPGFLTSQSADRFVSAIPCDVRSTILGIALVALAYVLGSAISPVACEFLNDEDWIGHVLPTEKQTQVRAYFTRMSLHERDQFVQINSSLGCEGLQEGSGRDFNVGNKCWEPLLQKFEFEESTLQLRGTDSTEHLNRLHERLTVLRGATFSGFVLLLLIVFALCAGCRAQLKGEAKPKEFIQRASRQFASWGAFLPSLVIVCFALRFGGEDLIKGKIDDMPIMETVLGLLGIFGVYLAARSIKPRAYINAWTCAFALFFTVLVYGGYAWTEVNYDQQVHQAFQAVPSSAPAASEKPALQTATSWVEAPLTSLR
jgi:hypothetical protein